MSQFSSLLLLLSEEIYIYHFNEFISFYVNGNNAFQRYPSNGGAGSKRLGNEWFGFSILIVY